VIEARMQIRSRRQARTTRVLYDGVQLPLSPKAVQHRLMKLVPNDSPTQVSFHILYIINKSDICAMTSSQRVHIGNYTCSIILS